MIYRCNSSTLDLSKWAAGSRTVQCIRCHTAPHGQLACSLVNECRETACLGLVKVPSAKQRHMPALPAGMSLLSTLKHTVLCCLPKSSSGRTAVRGSGQHQIPNPKLCNLKPGGRLRAHRSASSALKSTVTPLASCVSRRWLSPKSCSGRLSECCSSCLSPSSSASSAPKLPHLTCLLSAKQSCAQASNSAARLLQQTLDPL